MLKSKKVPAALVGEALRGIDDEAYLDLLVKLLEDKSKKTKFVNEYDRKGKLVRFAQSRGFEFDTIEKALAELKKI